jgi:acyl-CoA thioester hydrolase
MKPFIVQRRIEFHDTDMAGIVHFSNFFRFMEFAEVAFLRSLGLNVAVEWEGQKLGFPRVSATCDFQSPAKFEEILDIAVRLDSIGRKSVSYAFDFSRQGVPVARGKVTAVCCRISSEHQIEAIEIPASLREILLRQL